MAHTENAMPLIAMGATVVGYIVGHILIRRRYLKIPPAKRTRIAVKNIVRRYERNPTKPLLIVTWPKGDDERVTDHIGQAMRRIGGFHAVQSARGVSAPEKTGGTRWLASMRKQARKVAEGFGDTRASWIIAGEVVKEDETVKIHIIAGSGDEGDNLGVTEQRTYRITPEGEQELSEEIWNTLFPRAEPPDAPPCETRSPLHVIQPGAPEELARDILGHIDTDSPT